MNTDIHPSRPLSDRSALVTGATSGIGESIARALADQGAFVGVAGRDAERGVRVVESIEARGGRATFIPLDVAAPPRQLRDGVARATAALDGRVDILVNNAGIYPVPPTPDLSDDDLEAMLAVNVRGPHVLVAAIAPAMASRGSGSIIMIGSWMARVGQPFAALYSATKAADEQLTRSWAAEFGPRGVRVNAVAPGVTRTPGSAADTAVLDAMTAPTPAGHPLNPDDIARAVVFLTSDGAAMIHGTVLDVDGGITGTR